MQPSSGRGRHHSSLNTRVPQYTFCPACGNKYVRLVDSNSWEDTFCSSCGAQTIVYDVKQNPYPTYHNYPKLQKQKEGPDSRTETPDSDSSFFSREVKLCLIAICMLGLVIYWFFATPVRNHFIEDLKQKYPSQRNETWSHIQSVLDTDVPSVKSLILLHRGTDRRTVDCLTRHLLKIFSKNNKIKTEDVSFKNHDIRYRDYGEILEHYRPIIRENRVFIANLNEVPATTARIFHTLCDEVSSDIKPSLFIFTLQYGSQSETLRPLQRATNILKDAWKGLSSNEMFPLLSRVAKNVVDIQHEINMKCDIQL